MVTDLDPLHGHLIPFYIKEELERYNQIICPPRKPSWSRDVGPGRLARGNMGVPAEQTLSPSDLKLANSGIVKAHLRLTCILYMVWRHVKP